MTDAGLSHTQSIKIMILASFIRLMRQILLSGCTECHSINRGELYWHHREINCSFVVISYYNRDIIEKK